MLKSTMISRSLCLGHSWLILLKFNVPFSSIEHCRPPLLRYFLCWPSTILPHSCLFPVSLYFLSDWLNISCSFHFSSIAHSCLTLQPHKTQHTRPPYHPLLEFTQTHAHWVGNAIQPSHPLLSPSPPALNLSQHQGLFKWVSSWHQVAKVLEFQLQHQSFQWTPRTDLL